MNNEFVYEVPELRHGLYKCYMNEDMHSLPDFRRKISHNVPGLRHKVIRKLQDIKL